MSYPSWVKGHMQKMCTEREGLGTKLPLASISCLRIKIFSFEVALSKCISIDSSVIFYRAFISIWQASVAQPLQTPSYVIPQNLCHFMEQEAQPIAIKIARLLMPAVYSLLPV